MNKETITKINCHDELLDTWRNNFPEDWHFNEDGVISNEDWNNSNIKVLFVLKETNRANQNIVDAINRALVTKESGWWKGKVLRRVGHWAYGLLNYEDEAPSLKDAKTNYKNFIKNIAYINMKKASGGSSTKTKPFNSHVEEFAPFIRRQIELIKPDIIVLGGTYKQIKKYVFPELEKVSERIHKHNDMIFINAFHPAARKESSMLYYQVIDSFHKYKTGIRG